jgi:uncharacterized RmlC-like cupin family protein
MEQAAKLKHIPADALSADTAQTGGMRRSEAISGALGAQGIWMGTTVVAPHTSSAAHHHGHSETGIYVVSGTPLFQYREDGAIVDIATRPGDFVYVPPFVPHKEINREEEPAVVVIARTTQEAIAVNLDRL